MGPTFQSVAPSNPVGPTFQSVTSGKPPVRPTSQSVDLLNGAGAFDVWNGVSLP